MMSLKDIKRALRNGQYAWPGGYPLFFVSCDGEVLSFRAVKDNWRDVVYAHLRNNKRNGWAVTAIETNWEDTKLYCAHSGERIESAYGED